MFVSQVAVATFDQSLLFHRQSVWEEVVGKSPEWILFSATF